MACTTPRIALPLWFHESADPAHGDCARGHHQPGRRSGWHRRAKTIAAGLVDTNIVTSQVLICALLGGIIWNVVTWWLGLPSSSSHALIGGLCGATLAASHNK